MGSPEKGEQSEVIGEEERNEIEVKLNEKVEMKPWEQHSAVISIPRFDYKAPSSLLRHSLSGFLITCSIKREKSATKEAMSLLGKFVKAECVDNSDATVVSAKKRKICKDIEGETENLEATIAVNESADKSLDTKTETTSALSLVKLTKSGLLLLTFPVGVDVAVVDILSDLFISLEGGSVPSPQWCHRIFPIQSTCVLDEKELQTVVCRLVDGFLTDNRNKISQPLKFAVGYNRRGVEEETEKTDKKESSSMSSSLLDRSKCFSLVAAAVTKVVSDSVVDLKCPEVAVLVEVLPVSGIPDKRVVVGVSVLPGKLVSMKQRLSVKSLVSENNTKPSRDGKKR